jgi:hypothetical protein
MIWDINLRSVWVLALKGGIVGVHCSPDCVVRVDDSHIGRFFSAFSDREWAEKYIRDGGCVDIQPVSFGGSIVRLAGFVVWADEIDKVKNIVWDPICGHRNVRIVSVADFRRQIEERLSEAEEREL